MQYIVCIQCIYIMQFLLYKYIEKCSYQNENAINANENLIGKN